MRAIQNVELLLLRVAWTTSRCQAKCSACLQEIRRSDNASMMATKTMFLDPQRSVRPSLSATNKRAGQKKMPCWIHMSPGSLHLLIKQDNCVVALKPIVTFLTELTRLFWCRLLLRWQPRCHLSAQRLVYLKSADDHASDSGPCCSPIPSPQRMPSSSCLSGRAFCVADCLLLAIQLHDSWSRCFRFSSFGLSFCSSSTPHSFERLDVFALTASNILLTQSTLALPLA